MVQRSGSRAEGAIAALPSLSDRAVAGLLAERPSHGFEVATVFAKEGPLGIVWTIQRQQVYRALRHLVAGGLAEPVREEESLHGPARTVYALTAFGADEVETWLWAPVGRLRSVRHELLLKLAFLGRRGRDPAPLVRSQRRIAVEMARQCELRLAEAEAEAETDVEVEAGERIVLAWRLASARALLEMLDRLWPER